MWIQGSLRTMSGATAGRSAAPRPPAGAAAPLRAVAAGLLLAVPLGACGAGSHTATVDRLPAAEADAIDRVFAPWDDDGSPGAAVVVAHDGDVVYAAGYGSAHLEHSAPVTPSTPFHVASVSKPFTAMAVGLLASEGALSWDDEVAAHLDWFPDLGSPVTLRQLASHTSGVRDQWQLLQLAGWRMDDVITREQILRMMRRQRELNFEPGTRHLYSNMGYSLLAEVVEEVSGKPFGTFLEERFFEPLGMERTHVHDDHTRVVPGRAYSYVPGRSLLPADNAPRGGVEWRKAVLSYANQGATSLFTTAEDLGKWLVELSEAELLEPEVLDALTTPTRLENGEVVDYGLGFSLEGHRGRSTVGHGGADAGFRAHILHFPEEGLGLAVLANAPVAHTGVAVHAVADVLLDAGRAAAPTGDPAPASSGGAGTEGGVEGTATRERPPPDVPPALPAPGADASGSGLVEYAGTYYSPELDVIYRVRVVDGRLRLTPQRGPTYPLSQASGDAFRAPGPLPMSVEFRRDADGGVEAFAVTTARIEDLRFQRIDPLVPGEGR